MLDFLRRGVQRVIGDPTMPVYTEDQVPVPNFLYKLLGEPTDYSGEDSELQSMLAAEAPSYEFNPGGQATMPSPTGSTTRHDVPTGQPSLLKRMAPALAKMANGAIAATATPNLNGGGAGDIARSMMQAQSVLGNIDARHAAMQAQQADQARKQRESEAELLVRQKQLEAAEERVPVSAELARSSGMQVPYTQPTVMVPRSVAVTMMQNSGKNQPAAAAPSLKQQMQERHDIAVNVIGLQPGTPDYQHYMANGKLERGPTGEGKQSAADAEMEKFMVREEQAKRLGLQPNTPEYNYFVGDMKPPTEKKEGKDKGPTTYQLFQMGRAQQKDASAAADKAETYRQKEIARLEGMENGGNGNPGIHAERERVGQLYSDTKDPAERDKLAKQFNALNQKLRGIYKRKADIKAISPEAYQRMIQDIQDIPVGQQAGQQTGQPQGQPSGQPAPAAPQQKVRSYVPGKGLSR